MSKLKQNKRSQHLKKKVDSHELSKLIKIKSKKITKSKDSQK